MLRRMLLGTAGALAVRAQENDLLDGAIEWGRDLLEQYPGLQDLLLGAAAENAVPLLRAHLGEILRAAESALRETVTAEDLAELQPLLRQVASHAREIPEVAPYVDWLESRLDYFDAARRVVVTTPSPPPPRPPPSTPGRPPVRPRPPPDTARRRTQVLRSSDTWKRQAASHPRPGSARELVPRLKAGFRREGVPEPLVWMAEVESSMRPTARSPAGAVGLFQLMPATAKSLGLRLSPSDERLDPDRSAGAAARYLKLLHGRFASWPLALAAYNAGGARVAGLLKKGQARTFEAIAPRLPVETQMYVPRVLETIHLREGIDPARLPPPRAV